MTRINLIDPVYICDQQLLAEERELPRIPNNVNKGKVKFENIPENYVLGTGHVKFFYDKLLFLYERYDDIYDECIFRGFSVEWKFPTNIQNNGFWTPSGKEIIKNVKRMEKRIDEMKREPTYYKQQIGKKNCKRLLHQYLEPFKHYL